ncbi:hypothetical protein H9Q74_009045 [Fusarium xylarioides]|nr:hypothetical protein H9Q71_013575 [Fusarium xylarioides]KAG5820138.1 hypothetical protein H9Q74_009045 [Fusarium xylarioides]
MDKQLQEIKMENMQDRLDSLELRFKELANNFPHLSAKQLSKQCISCMEDIRSLASDCLIANTDRYLHDYDRADFIKYARDHRQSMRFDVDANNMIRCNRLEAGHHRQMKEEERGDHFISLKAGVPPAKFCFPPYNPNELFVDLAANLESLTSRELEYHRQPYVPDAAVTSQPPPPYESQDRGLQYRASPHPTASAMPPVESSFGSGTSFVSIATEMSGDEESKEEYFKAWAQRQAYKSVIPDLDPEGDPTSSFDEGDIEVLTTTRDRLRDKNWDSGPVLEMEVPAPHPLLPDWMDEVQSLVTEDISEFGLVVAWRYYGTGAWMDRYGHLVPVV